jgi:hypothetical protein
LRNRHNLLIYLQLENKIQEVSNEIDLSIDLLASEDLTKFVIKHEPELLFKADDIW